MKITAILPVSRIQYLDRVLGSLLDQTHKPENLLVIYDGEEQYLLEARNKIVGLEFNNVLFVQSDNLTPAHSIPDRRRHITNIHNQFRELIVDADWVFSIEDDGVLPQNALSRLVNVVNTHENVGMVTGVELGRWGVPYVGAWTVDDVHDTKLVTSVENLALQTPFTIQEIDACGLYCALIKAEEYKQHTFFTNNGLGPDVNLGIYLRQKGLYNYIDWGVPVTHLTNRAGLEMEIPATDRSRVVKLTLLAGSVWQSSR
jgi:hypothetical protein